MFLCHGFCELGATPFAVFARQLRQFVDRNPREVLVVVIEDHLPVERIADELRKAGLDSLLLPVDEGEPLPSLGAMIDAGTRVFATLENGDGGPTLRNAFAGYVEETPYSFLRASALRGEESCAANRGTDGAPVFQLNHWVTPPRRRAAAAVNSRVVLGARVEECRAVRGRAPTLVAVDFEERGDVLAIVRDLNRG